MAVSGCFWPWHCTNSEWLCWQSAVKPLLSLTDVALLCPCAATNSCLVTELQTLHSWHTMQMNSEMRAKRRNAWDGWVTASSLWWLYCLIKGQQKTTLTSVDICSYPGELVSTAHINWLTARTSHSAKSYLCSSWASSEHPYVQTCPQAHSFSTTAFYVETTCKAATLLDSY